MCIVLVSCFWGPSAHAAPVNALIVGEIDRITLNNPGDVWSGGVIVIGAENVIIPRNLLIDLPANRLSLQQLFIPTPGNPVSSAPAACITAGETGLAKFDTCNASGTGAFATIAANRLDTGTVIAGDVFIRKGIETITGKITFIDYDQGFFMVNGLLNDPSTGVMVRLNDPTGRHTVQQGSGCTPGNAVNCSPDPRFTLDPDNYVNVFTTGYPYCIPSTVARTFVDVLGLGVTTSQSAPNGTGDILCPNTNRSINGGQPVDDSRRFAPVLVGDDFTATGNYETISGVPFFSAHSSKVLRALATKPLSTQPDYMFIEQAFIEAPGFQDQQIQALYFGSTTRAPADVVIWSVHHDPLANQGHEFLLATTLGCDAAAGVGSCTAKAVLPTAGIDIFSVSHVVDFRFLPTARLLDPCAHLRADVRFIPLNVCPGGGTLAEQFSILSPVPRQIHGRTGQKLSNPGLITLDVRGNQATNGQYFFQMGIGLGSIQIPDFFGINLNLVFTPFIFEGIPWNNDRRLSPGGCIGPCEAAPQPLSPFPVSGLDPRIQASTPIGPYIDPNYNNGILSVANNRVLSFVTQISPGVFNFNGNSSLLAYPPAAPPRPADIGIFRSGLWALDLNGNGTWDGIPPDQAIFFGIPGDVPVAGDWNGTGTSKIGIFRDGLWALDLNGNGAWDGVPPDQATFFGIPGDVPVVGDWTGTGTSKIGIFRNGMWALDMNGNGAWDGVPTDQAFFFGEPGDIPVTGDWSGDGKTKVGIYRNGMWALDVNGNGIWDGTPTDQLFFFGIPGDIPVTGDWNGDGKTRIGVYRNGTWLLDMNGDGVFNFPGDNALGFGIPGDKPVTGKW